MAGSSPGAPSENLKPWASSEPTWWWQSITANPSTDMVLVSFAAPAGPFSAMSQTFFFAVNVTLTSTSSKCASLRGLRTAPPRRSSRYTKGQLPPLALRGVPGQTSGPGPSPPKQTEPATTAFTLAVGRLSGARHVSKSMKSRSGLDQRGVDDGQQPLEARFGRPHALPTASGGVGAALGRDRCQGEQDAGCVDLAVTGTGSPTVGVVMSLRRWVGVDQ